MRTAVLTCLSLLLLLSGGTLRAQDEAQQRFPDAHQLVLSIGGPTFGLAMVDGYFSVDRPFGLELASLYTSDYSFDSGPLVGLSYAFRCKPEWMFGADLLWSYFSVTETPSLTNPDRQVREKSQQLLTLLPTARWIVHDGKYILFYLKAGVGVHLSAGEWEKTRLRAAYQFNPIGFQFGRGRLCGILEWGLGNVEMIRLGLGYNF